MSLPVFTDDEIAALISEPKLVPPDFNEQLAMKPKNPPTHKQGSITIIGGKGSQFILHLRQSIKNPTEDYSAILSLQLVGHSDCFMIKRYNGPSHIHTNVIEKTTIKYVTHIHMATERYQKLGRSKTESFAEETDRYSNVKDAFNCLLEDCNFLITDEESILSIPGVT